MSIHTGHHTQGLFAAALSEDVRKNLLNAVDNAAIMYDRAESRMARSRQDWYRLEQQRIMSLAQDILSNLQRAIDAFPKRNPDNIDAVAMVREIRDTMRAQERLNQSND